MTWHIQLCDSCSTDRAGIEVVAGFREHHTKLKHLGIPYSILRWCIQAIESCGNTENKYMWRLVSIFRITRRSNVFSAKVYFKSNSDCCRAAKLLLLHHFIDTSLVCFCYHNTTVMSQHKISRDKFACKGFVAFTVNDPFKPWV